MEVLKREAFLYFSLLYFSDFHTIRLINSGQERRLSSCHFRCSYVCALAPYQRVLARITSGIFQLPHMITVQLVWALTYVRPFEKVGIRELRLCVRDLLSFYRRAKAGL